MKRTPKTPQIATLETRKLADLRPYPRQAEYFGDLAEPELAGLAAAMLSGNVPPIEVLPHNKVGLPVNTILRGHQRLRAAKLNGFIDLTVLVRYDLSNADAATIEREFLSDNHHRRHESTISRARVAIRLMELEARKEMAGVQDAAKRDRVGKIIGMSGRNLDRYLNLLNTPRPVQDAFEQKRLSLNLASRVGSSLPRHKQAEIARRIEQGEDPTKVVRATLAPQKRQPLSAGAAIVALADALGQAEIALLCHSVGATDVRRHESALRSGGSLIARLLAIVDSRNKPARQDEEE